MRDSESNLPARSLVISMVIHALLFGLLLWLALRNPVVSDGLQESSIQLDAVINNRPSATRRGSIRKTERSMSRGASAGISLGDLGMHMAPLESHVEPEYDSNVPSQTDGQSRDFVPDGDWDLLNPDPRLARFNQYIYKTVQGWLDRDAYLNTERIYGTVKVKIWFSPEGEYLENETLFEFQDENFKAIVARALRKSFNRPVPRAFLSKKEKFYIERSVVIRQF
jgi:hypothetical protein